MGKCSSKGIHMEDKYMKDKFAFDVLDEATVVWGLTLIIYYIIYTGDLGKEKYLGKLNTPHRNLQGNTYNI